MSIIGLGFSPFLLAQEVSATKADLHQRIQEIQKAKQEVASSEIEAQMQVRRLRETGRWQRPEERCLADCPEVDAQLECVSCIEQHPDASSLV